MIQKTGPNIDARSIGSQIYELIEQLFPLHRSQTGAGNRQSFELLSKWVPLSIVETPSGNDAYGWTIPKEWSIREAFISYRGERIVDYQDSNLHVLNGSRAYSGHLKFAELREKLCLHEQMPEAIPYRTAFFRDDWGFCVTQSQFELLEQLDGPFEVRIDSSEMNGFLCHAELDTQPDAEESILIWAHCCHPSLANDNLSGMATAILLARHLLAMETRFNYRFVLAPATIGAINWLATNRLESFQGGLVLSLLGDSHDFHYKKTPSGNSIMDRVFDLLSSRRQPAVQQLEFEPFGYDERQFCSPSSKLHVGRLTRALPGKFPEYHSSLDNLDLVHANHLEESFNLILEAVEILEANELLFNTQGQCEPFLQPHDLYRPFGENSQYAIQPESVMYVLNMADGKHDLIDIAKRSGLAFDNICSAASKLKEIGILQPVGEAH